MSYTSPLLAAVPGLRHSFFTRDGGVSTGIYRGLNGGLGSHDDPSHVQENRKRMAEAMGVAPSHFLTAFQVHSPDVAIAAGPWPGEQRPKVDAMVTRVPGLALGVTTADCGPVLFADPVARVIGVAHAGWKGAFTGVLEGTIDAMESLGALRTNITVAIGPLIRQPSYEVGPEFVARFTDADPEFIRFFAPSSRETHALFDLAAFIQFRLQKAGIAHIDDLAIDTYPNDDLFSYRRSVHRKEPDYGRQIHCIVLT